MQRRNVEVVDSEAMQRSRIKLPIQTSPPAIFVNILELAWEKTMIQEAGCSCKYCIQEMSTQKQQQDLFPIYKHGLFSARYFPEMPG